MYMYYSYIFMNLADIVNNNYSVRMIHIPSRVYIPY
jgi:hypothetical protein